MGRIQTNAWEAYWAQQGLRWLDRRLAKRERAVVAAVAEVDPDFALDPAELRRFAVERIAAQRDAWRAGEVATIAELLHTTYRDPSGRYTFEYQGDPIARVQWAFRQADEDPWRIVLFVTLQLHRKATSRGVALRDLGANEWDVVAAWWTVERDGAGGWRIAQVEEDDRGLHYRKDPLPNAPRDAELHDEATVEVASGDRAGDGVAALTEADGPVRSRLLDLSLVDGRFAPDAIAACAGEIARAWEAATERGAHDELAHWSTPEVARLLCHPTPNGIRRVRNLAVERVRITALDNAHEPPRVQLEAHLHGLRWLADLHGSHTPISGNDRNARSFAERWTLELGPAGDGAAPWRLVNVERPGRR
jgi:hypothetical protein